MSRRLAHSPAGETAIAVQDLTFAWPGGAPVLDIPELHIARNEKVFVEGPSGSGKSTLLGLIGGVLTPARGKVMLLGQNLGALSAAGRDRFRAEHLGIVFQMFNLLPYLSLIDNVILPCRFSLRRREAALAATGTLTGEARRLLAHLGLKDEALLRRPVTQLSVGQQQRVAAARALIGGPEILIADEPTSALDARAQGRFLELLIEECERAQSALVFVSHDTALSRFFTRTIALPEVNRAAQAPEEEGA
ncbi:ABC transporter ATP-binding protein [Tepidicaulis marinus]|nr:ABC transporter ATP-binding protein [Tepidicaulis marinus]